MGFNSECCISRGWREVDKLDVSCGKYRRFAEYQALTLGSQIEIIRYLNYFKLLIINTI